MGFELDVFANPDSISPSLLCPICQMVVENPVVTPSDHLFCEACLLEWLTKSNLCPMTQMELSPESITKPSRLVLNILSDLKRKCENFDCKWTGTLDEYQSHRLSCPMRSRVMLMRQVDDLVAQNAELSRRIHSLEKSCSQYESTNAELHQELQVVQCL
jgi:Zinc finger, C3HC4 type (RING finger)